MNVREAVLEAYKEVLSNSNLSVEPDLNNAVSRETGLDSLGIVNFVILIEEKLDVNLDPVLGDIRRSKDLNQVVDLIEALMK